MALVLNWLGLSIAVSTVLVVFLFLAMTQQSVIHVPNWREAAPLLSFLVKIWPLFIVGFWGGQWALHQMNIRGFR